MNTGTGDVKPFDSMVRAPAAKKINVERFMFSFDLCECRIPCREEKPLEQLVHVRHSPPLSVCEPVLLPISCNKHTLVFMMMVIAKAQPGYATCNYYGGEVSCFVSLNYRCLWMLVNACERVAMVC